MERLLNQPDCGACILQNSLDLQREIIRIFSLGLSIDDSVRNFALTMTGRTLDRDLLFEIMEKGDSELEMVLDLIFFPDDSVRSKIEPVIPDLFHESDEAELIMSVIRTRPVCRIILDAPSSPHEIMPEEKFIEGFIKRLNLCMCLPENLSSLLSKRFGPEKDMARMVIRSLMPPKKALCMIEDFLSLVSDIFPPEPDDLKTVILISGMFPKEDEFITALCLAFEKWDYALKRIEDFEKAMSSGCMEELMARGMRPPSASRADVEKKLSGAERIMELLRFNPNNQEKLPKYSSAIPVSLSY